MKVRMIQVIRMSAVAFLPDKFSRKQRENASEMSYEEAQDNLLTRFRAQRQGEAKHKDRQSQTETIFLAEIRLYTSCRSFFDALICCTAVSKFIARTLILSNGVV